MDNLESIFQDIRRQIEEEFTNLPFQASNQQNNNNNNNTNHDITGQDIINITNDYISLYRQHQETFSIFNLNMLSLILLLRDYHDRLELNNRLNRLERTDRRNQEEQRGRQQTRDVRVPDLDPLINPMVNSPRQNILDIPLISTSPRRHSSENIARRNVAFQNRLGGLRRNMNSTPPNRSNPRLNARRHTIFNISDLSRNIRATRPFFSPRIPTQRDGRFFFGGLGPELRDVVVRPTNEEIQTATRRFVYNSEPDLLNRRCPITMEDFQDGDNLIQIIPCGHNFKDEPLINWFQEHVRCPVCRYDIRDYVPNNGDSTSSDDSDIRQENSNPSSPINPRLTRSFSGSGMTTTSSVSSLHPSSPLNINPMERVESILSEVSNYSDLDNYEETINENFIQDISNGVGQILDNLISDMSNSSIPPLGYSVSVPLVYHGFFDTSNNQAFTNFQFPN